MDKIKFAIPKGSLEKATAEFFSKSGFKIGGTERTYRPSINDPQIEMKVLRPQEIPVFVSEGLQDLGITGEDWVKENRADVEILQNLEYGKIRLVIAVPKTCEKSPSKPVPLGPFSRPFHPPRLRHHLDRTHRARSPGERRSSPVSSKGAS